MKLTIAPASYPVDGILPANRNSRAVLIQLNPPGVNCSVTLADLLAETLEIQARKAPASDPIEELTLVGWDLQAFLPLNGAWARTHNRLRRSAPASLRLLMLEDCGDIRDNYVSRLAPSFGLRLTQVIVHRVTLSVTCVRPAINCL